MVKKIMSLESKDGSIMYTLTQTELKLSFTNNKLSEIGKIIGRKCREVEPILDCELAIQRYFSNLCTIELEDIKSARVTPNGSLVIQYANGRTNKTERLSVKLSDNSPMYTFTTAMPNFFKKDHAKVFVRELISARDKLNHFLALW